MTTDTDTEPVRPESREWAHRVIEGVRAVQALHTPVTMYDGYDTLEEAEQHNDGVVETTVICAECTRVAQANCGGDSWTWEEHPCATAIAGGFAESPLL